MSWVLVLPYFKSLLKNGYHVLSPSQSYCLLLSNCNVMKFPPALLSMAAAAIMLVLVGFSFSGNMDFLDKLPFWQYYLTPPSFLLI